MKILQHFVFKILKNNNPVYCKNTLILIKVIFEPTRGRVYVLVGLASTGSDESINGEKPKSTVDV